jgi:hypothetical protein
MRTLSGAKNLSPLLPHQHRPHAYAHGALDTIIVPIPLKMPPGA